MSLRTIIWLGPFIFLIHDLEEVFLTQQWIKKHSYLFKGTVVERLVNTFGYSPGEFGLVVGIITILYGIICYFAAKQIKAGMSMNLYAATLLILFINVFTHLGQSILLKMYTPGVITSLLIVLPYTLYAFRKLKAANMITKTTWITSLFMSIGMVFIIFGLMFLVGRCFS
ncbi:uncharacterized protein with HXXEE motif [Anoxybacillus vitaminiphilus]|uniref:Uncharacterized protein with HXXEE motif n=1 Tax=Paranoxybacillus vitaminiphilus TaxID=581036 RepID=A0A327YTL1_9BACL|nr:uncharacterized protein with HXXEE motif [Anoxybacillus vitaminiphilus]